MLLTGRRRDWVTGSRVDSYPGSAGYRDLNASAAGEAAIVVDMKLLRCSKPRDPGTGVSDLIAEATGAAGPNKGVLPGEGFVGTKYLAAGGVNDNPPVIPRRPWIAGEAIGGFAYGDLGGALDGFTAGKCQVRQQLVGLADEAIVLDETRKAGSGQTHEDAGDDQRREQLDERKPGKPANFDKRPIFTDKRSDTGLSGADKRYLKADKRHTDSSRLSHLGTQFRCRFHHYFSIRL